MESLSMHMVPIHLGGDSTRPWFMNTATRSHSAATLALSSPSGPACAAAAWPCGAENASCGRAARDRFCSLALTCASTGLAPRSKLLVLIEDAARMSSCRSDANPHHQSCRPACL